MSNVGTWMQRTAQDWIVLTHLTRHNATAMGIGAAALVGIRHLRKYQGLRIRGHDGRMRLSFDRLDTAAGTDPHEAGPARAP
ncbi:MULTISPECIES: hypothetical protein [Cupriavidus]